MSEVRSWIEAEGSGHWFFIAFPVCLLMLLVILKGRRLKFVLPSLIITLVIVNPWFFSWWDDLGLYAYWRILWVVPVIPIVAALIPAVMEKLSEEKEETARKKSVINNIGKMLIPVIGVVCFLIFGTYIFKSSGGSFVEAENAEKVPENLREIAEKLTERDQNPKIISEPSVSVYIRQYDSRIHTLFGRDIYGYITEPGTSAHEVYYALNNNDWNTVKQVMLDEDFDYLVTRRDPGERFQLVESVAGYGLYKTQGYPRVRKQRNELGQVLSVTSINEKGNPVNNEYGYATAFYSYDSNGNINREWYADANGIGVADQFGWSGREWDIDSKGHITREVKLGTGGKPSMGELGFSEVRRQFDGDTVVSEAYYDPQGNPIEQVGGYASFKATYDREGNIIEKEYFDVKGNPVNRADGYAKAIIGPAENGEAKRIVFYDLDGKTVDEADLNLVQGLILNPDGWSEWITPQYNKSNACQNIGRTNLGSKEKGDMYTCTVEVEFKGVTVTKDQDFLFRTQGAQDGKWNTGNVWNSKLANIEEAPPDGLYSFVSTVKITEKMMNISFFNIGFRCDFWASGSYRVRIVKIGKDRQKNEWSPGV